MTRVFATLCFALTVVLASSVQAQQVPHRQNASPNIFETPPNAQPANSPSGTGGLSDVINLSLNMAHIINLPSTPQNIIVGNETVTRVTVDPDHPKQAYLTALALGSSNIIFLDRTGNIIHQVEVRVGQNTESIKSALKQLLPDESIKISVYNDNVFLSGKMSSADSVTSAVNIARRFVTADENIINMLTLKGSQQVIIKVRVSEISRTTLKELSTGLSASKHVRLTGTGPGRIGNLIEFITGSTTAATTYNTANAPFGRGIIDSRISGVGPVAFDVLERQGLVKTLAEPTLMAVSGEPASFLVGGSIPTASGFDSFGNVICCNYQDYGIGLDFVPVVIDEGQINLNISTSISELGANVVIGASTVPQLITKRAQTTVNLPSGGFVMIAGLLKDNTSDTINGFPFLKDIPILGAFFRSTNFQNDVTELVITISAYLAKPVGNDTPLSLPTDGFEAASDIDFYLLGRLHRQYTKGDDLPIWASPLKGPFGYIME